jgi:transglutaminase-like putative cysteine protease
MSSAGSALAAAICYLGSLASLGASLCCSTSAQAPTTWGAVDRTARYEYRLMNATAQSARDITVYVPLPRGSRRQQVHYLQLSRLGYRGTITDRDGQRFAEYHIAELLAGAYRDFGFVAGVTLRSQRWPTSADQRVADLDAETRARYLTSQANYSMDTEVMRQAAAGLAAGGGDDLARLTRIHDFVCDRIGYLRDDRWDPAATVLRRGTGSCSEYNYVLSGLCRLAGLPTRQVGGSSCRGTRLPYTDVVFHRWTEVFLRGIGWFPADCSRDADPVRGRRGGFGAVHADVLVCSRGAGGAGDHLGCEYRAQREVRGEDPGLSCSHRCRWFALVEPAALARAARWLEHGIGLTPTPDAVECALLHYDAVPHEAQVRAIAALADGGRAVALRRAAALRLPQPAHLDLLRGLTAGADLAPRIVRLGTDPWRLHIWWSSHEPRLAGDGAARLTLGPAPPADHWILRGVVADERIPDRLLTRALAALRLQLDRWRGADGVPGADGVRGDLAVVCVNPGAPNTAHDPMAALTLTRDTGRHLRATRGVQLIDRAGCDAELVAGGGTAGEFWAWAMRDRGSRRERRAAELAAEPAIKGAVDVVVAPLLRREESAGQFIHRLELRALHLDRREIFATTVSYAVTPE